MNSQSEAAALLESSKLDSVELPVQVRVSAKWNRKLRFLGNIILVGAGFTNNLNNN